MLRNFSILLLALLSFAPGTRGQTPAKPVSALGRVAVLGEVSEA